MPRFFFSKSVLPWSRGVKLWRSLQHKREPKKPKSAIRAQIGNTRRLPWSPYGIYSPKPKPKKVFTTQKLKTPRAQDSMQIRAQKAHSLAPRVTPKNYLRPKNQPQNPKPLTCTGQIRKSPIYMLVGARNYGYYYVVYGETFLPSFPTPIG